MATSQLKLYSSGDSASIQLTGLSGSLISVLNSILVTGYGSQTAAGWSVPLVNGAASGSFKQGSGSLGVIYINDSAPGLPAGTKEAWVTGWESITANTAPVGTGSGQFPLPAQLLTTGHCVMRKSTTNDSTTRPWICFADAWTFYFFAQGGDAVGMYGSLFFGDIFSLKSTTDNPKIFLGARLSENTNAGANTVANVDANDIIGGVGQLSTYNYMSRNSSNVGTSILVFKTGDMSKASAPSTIAVLTGGLQTPNGPDNTIYLCPLSVMENSGNVLRGRMRGMYQVCHPVANFGDGQIIYGANELVGKTFMIVKGGYGLGFWAIETSATVETNS